MTDLLLLMALMISSTKCILGCELTRFLSRCAISRFDNNYSRDVLRVPALNNKEQGRKGARQYVCRARERSIRDTIFRTN